MAQGISLIVGLGNPGAEYAETRHNAGFRFLDVLLDATGGKLRAESRFTANAGKISLSGKDIWLLEPQTFMNHSGESVSKFAHYFKIPASEILVAHDDLDLPPGTIRLKVGGGDGGHNGLADITEKLGTSDYARLRIGIGHPGNAAQVVSYVLKRAPAAEQTLIEAAIGNGKAHLAEMVHGELQKVMNSLHTHK
ncbi:MAG: aminoacyl-tRNA hydrolase [Sulfuricaulis sp.]|uniref:aminoacyl-tRNA hydrolase n=1 Tax=Sulfuricaulis sp. TaxID=2003553 RepID=UPI0025E25655|nr:aminoacyl-tRNA hydrolase [Sulfuricaulis sp.]MCR4347007.1 aminoacyl-tRNA hydrolase [Sulfuricaulis sp.]